MSILFDNLSFQLFPWWFHVSGKRQRTQATTEGRKAPRSEETPRRKDQESNRKSAGWTKEKGMS